MSARTSISKPLDASGGMRPKGWRKPVPKLIPDPPKRHNSVSRSSSFRHLVLLPTNEPQPPMPDNWKENIDKALGKGSRVERIRSPMPPHHSRTNVSILESGASREDVSTSTRRHRRRGEEKALPMLPDTHATDRLSDAGSTFTESTTSTTVEPSIEPPADASARSSGHLNDEPPVPQQMRPAQPEFEKRGTQVSDDRQFYDAQYRIVYPQGLNCSKLDVTRRHVAVYPSLPRATTDRDNVSVDLTALETLDDGRSVRHPYSSSVMLDKVVRHAEPRRSDTHALDADMGCMGCVSHMLRGFVRHRTKTTPCVTY